MSREQSAIIKGLAILLMLARPAHFIEITGEVDNVVTWILSGATNVICYFLIVSGYGLYLAYNKELDLVLLLSLMVHPFHILL